GFEIDADQGWRRRPRVPSRERRPLRRSLREDAAGLADQGTEVFPAGEGQIAEETSERILRAFEFSWLHFDDSHQRDSPRASAFTAAVKQAIGAVVPPAPIWPTPASRWAMPLLMTGSTPQSTTLRASMPAAAA